MVDVTIACNVKGGMLLQLFRAQAGGPRGYRVVTDGDPIFVKGPASGYALNGGFAHTNVPLDFWTEWLAQNRAHGYVLAGRIHALDLAPAPREPKEEAVVDPAAEGETASSA